MKNKLTAPSGFLNLCICLRMFAFILGMLLATFAAGHPQPSTHKHTLEMGNHFRLKGIPVAPGDDVYQAWVARYNGPDNSDDEATAIAVDGSGNVYVTGFSFDSHTASDYATVKYDSAGQEQWVARYDGHPAASA